MALSAPTFVNAGASSGGAGGITVGLPASVAKYDLLVIFCETANEAVSTPSGWTAVTAQGTGTAAGATSTRISIFYKIHSGSESDVSISDPGDHIVGRMLAFRGVDIASPIHTSNGDTGASDTAVTFPAVTTTKANCLIISTVANATDTTLTTCSGYTNASLSSITERSDSGTISGNGGSLAVMTGILASAGASGGTTATLSAASVQARITLAIAPAAIMAAALGQFSVNGPSFPGRVSLNVDPAQDFVFEDFEKNFGDSPNTKLPAGVIDENAFTPGASWEVFTGSVARSASHTTEGSFSWEIQGAAIDADYVELRLVPTYGFNLFGAETLELDLFIVDIDAVDYVKFTVYDATSTEFYAETSPGQTGAVTLSVDLTGSTDLRNCTISIVVFGPGETQITSDCIVHVDNLFRPAIADVDYPMVAAVGEFTLSGLSTTLTRTRHMLIELATFSTEGLSVRLLRGLFTLGSLGEFTVSGLPALLKAGYQIAAVVGEFTLTGVNAIMLYGAKAFAGLGAFTVSGQTVAGKFARKLSAATADFTIGIVARILGPFYTDKAPSVSDDIYIDKP